MRLMTLILTILIGILGARFTPRTGEGGGLPPAARGEDPGARITAAAQAVDRVEIMEGADFVRPVVLADDLAYCTQILYSLQVGEPLDGQPPGSPILLYDLAEGAPDAAAALYVRGDETFCALYPAGEGSPAFYRCSGDLSAVGRILESCHAFEEKQNRFDCSSDYPPDIARAALLHYLGSLAGEEVDARYRVSAAYIHDVHLAGKSGETYLFDLFFDVAAVSGFFEGSPAAGDGFARDIPRRVMIEAAGSGSFRIAGQGGGEIGARINWQAGLEECRAAVAGAEGVYQFFGDSDQALDGVTLGENLFVRDNGEDLQFIDIATGQVSYELPKPIGFEDSPPRAEEGSLMLCSGDSLALFDEHLQMLDSLPLPDTFREITQGDPGFSDDICCVSWQYDAAFYIDKSGLCVLDLESGEAYQLAPHPYLPASGDEGELLRANVFDSISFSEDGTMLTVRRIGYEGLNGLSQFGLEDGMRRDIPLEGSSEALSWIGERYAVVFEPESGEAVVYDFAAGTRRVADAPLLAQGTKQNDSSSYITDGDACYFFLRDGQDYRLARMNLSDAGIAFGGVTSRLCPQIFCIDGAGRAVAALEGKGFALVDPAGAFPGEEPAD